MATAPEKQHCQGSEYLNMSVMGDTCNDSKCLGDEQSHTYETLNDVPKITATRHNTNKDTTANKENVWLKSGVMVSRWMIILAVLVITALISALTGITVYHVTTSTSRNEDTLPPQDQGITEINRRLNTMQEKQNAFDDLVHGMREKQHVFDDIVQITEINRRLNTMQEKQNAFDDLVHGMREKQHVFDDIVQAMDEKHNSSVVSSRDYRTSIDRRFEALGDAVQTVQADQNSSEIAVTPLVAFRANHMADKSPATDQTLVFTTSVLNEGQGYDKVTGQFTAPTDGLYHLSVQLCFVHQKSMYYDIVVDNVIVNSGTFYDQDAYTCSSADTSVVMRRNMKAWVKCASGSSSDVMNENRYRMNIFSGFLVHKI